MTELRGLVLLGLGALLVYSALWKLHFRWRFASAVYGWKIFDRRGSQVVVAVLPWLELVIGLSCVAAAVVPNLPDSAAAAVAAALFAALASGLMLIARRARGARCGCLSESGKVGGGAIFRAWALSAAAVAVALGAPP